MSGIFTFIFGYVLVTKFSTAAVFVSTISLPLVYFVLYKNLTLAWLNFEIKLSRKGIEIGDKFYQWTEIEETFLVYRKDRLRTIYLVIGLKNGILDRYHMNNLLEFNLNEKTLSALIEEYRKP